MAKGVKRDLKSPQDLQIGSPTSPLQAAMQGMAVLLNTHLSKTELDLCIQLLQAEIHPKALADVILPLIKARKKKAVPKNQ